MARQTTKTPPGRKRTVGKKQMKPSTPKKVNYEVISIVVIALSLLVGISFFTQATGVVGGAIKDVAMGLFGPPAYLLCFAGIGCGVHFVAKKDLSKYAYKYWLALAAILCCSMLWHVFAGTMGSYRDFWSLGMDGQGGGLLGGFFADPLLPLLSKVGCAIVLLAVLLILIISIFEISIVQLFRTVYQHIADRFGEEREVYEEGDEPQPPGDTTRNMPRHVKKEIDRMKKQIFDFEKEFGELSEGGKKSATAREQAAPPTDRDAPPLFAQQEVQATQEPDQEAIHQAIEVAAETALLPRKRRREEPAHVEIEMENEHVDYTFPSLHFLKESPGQSPQAQEALERTARKLIETLESFGVAARIIDYSQGPTITRYELQPNAGVKISKITSLADDIALNLAAVGIRIEPIAGKTAIGIEVPNEILTAVYVREVIGSAEFVNFPSKVAFALGKDIAGKPIVGDIARMPHLLIAGSTGSGKSVCINTLITSILYKASPNEVKLVMVDPKVVELGVYNGIPHLLIPVVTDPRKAAGALQWAVNEMTNRYKLFADNNVRDLKGYNTWARENEAEELPQIVIIIDELADLMMVAPNDVEDSICRLAQMARAAGMHLVIATQRPSVDVITGIIKANIPSRIAFAVSSFVDSKTILDMGGAEKLLGKGDMLYYPIGSAKPIRAQGAFVSDKEVENIVAFVKGQNDVQYNQDVIEQIESAGERPNAGEDRGGNADELLPQAVEMAIDAGQASVAMYQRRLKVGYQRAARLIDQMETRGIIGKFDGTKPREVLITKAQWNEMLMNIDTTGGQLSIDDDDDDDFEPPF